MHEQVALVGTTFSENGDVDVAPYVSVTLTHESGLDGFYERFGFQAFKDIARIWKPGDGDQTL